MLPLAQMDLPNEGPISYEFLNIRATRKKVQLTICGKVRSLNTITILEWIYLSVSLLGLATSFGLSLQRIFVNDLDTGDFTFAILLLVTIVFCAYYVIDSMLTERGDELLVFVISNIIVFIYCIVNFVDRSRNTIKLVRLIIISVLSPFLIGVGTYQSIKYFKSNKLLLYTVGASRDLQKACKLFNFCVTLLKFDFQLQLSMLILVMGTTGLDLDLEQKIFLGSGIPITVIVVVLGFLALRKESWPIMIAFYIIGLLDPAYIAYKFYYAATNEQFGKSGGKSAIYNSTYACGCFAFVVWVLLYAATGYFGTHHFGKGLRNRIFENLPPRTPAAPAPESGEA